MNEQLVVKNFGPIKDATVDFKRVTVFIGPTGGGKSTLAKLAAIFRDSKYSFVHSLSDDRKSNSLTDYSLDSHKMEQSEMCSFVGDVFKFFNQETHFIIAKLADDLTTEYNSTLDESTELSRSAVEMLNSLNIDQINPSEVSDKQIEEFKKIIETAKNLIQASQIKNKSVFDGTLKGAYGLALNYIPAERVFLPAIEYSWAGLMRDDIGLPKLLLGFANSFSLSRKEISELNIPFLNVKYLHIDGRDFIKIPEREEPLMLLETASGIQSVTPLLVLLEHLSRNTEQAQSFIIEEPELNLYPTAQQGLLNWLVEKCTKGENDLTITTHSPYILSSCNLLLEAYKVAQQRPELADEIDKIVPRACWLNPDEFAAYYVADGTVKPITDDRTHLIGSNELDAVSGDISDSFRQLLRLQKQKPASI